MGYHKKKNQYGGNQSKDVNSLKKKNLKNKVNAFCDIKDKQDFNPLKFTTDILQQITSIILDMGKTRKTVEGAFSWFGSGPEWDKLTAEEKINEMVQFFIVNEFFPKISIKDFFDKILKYWNRNMEKIATHLHAYSDNDKILQHFVKITT